MSVIRKVVTENAPYYVGQKEIVSVVRNLFGGHYTDFKRLLNVLGNGQIECRYFAAPFFAIVQVLRIGALSSLGRFWNTKILKHKKFDQI